MTDDIVQGFRSVSAQQGARLAENNLNDKLAGFADGKRVRFLNINDRLADKDGRLVEGVLSERDKLHPTLKGYQIWADALTPIFREIRRIWQLSCIAERVPQLARLRCPPFGRPR